MRILAHIVLLFCVMLYSLSVPVTWGLYYLRADAIAKRYCENPDKPSCHGKCHIAKLTGKRQADNDTPPLAEPNIQKPLFFFTAAEKVCPAVESFAVRYPSLPSLSLHSGYRQDVYHPPA